MLENYSIRLPGWLKWELQKLRFNKKVTMYQLLYAMLKTCEKNATDFDYYLWEAKRLR